MSFLELTPHQIVAELDKYIIGQISAKRAVAVALRNRFRRSQLDAKARADIAPKNILMIGPTGVGKTEIARRLANLSNAPLLKIEATKFTEVGYVGRDVDAIARDLVEISIAMVEKERIEEAKPRAAQVAKERLLDLIAPLPRPQNPMQANPFIANFPGMFPPSATTETERVQLEQAQRVRDRMAQKLEAGELEESEVEIEIEEKRPSNMQFFGMEGNNPDIGEMLSGIMPANRKKRRVKVKEARQILENQEAEKLVDRDAIASEAIERAQERGIVFLDEIDKIAGRSEGGNPAISREGVQRDLLPLVEGSTVSTKYGPVKTDHMLFIAAGAFHVSKPSDLIPELQGRFPVRVELEPLLEEDLRRILTEPSNSLLNQYSALLAADGVQLEWTPEGIAELARLATQVNDSTENIGARRLHTLLEKVLEEISFSAPETDETTVRITAPYVRARLAHLIDDDDLSRLML
jgi:ATP-dependent HslUV protease ATP-binding subunit HslU